jgi:hypothetical protein
MRVVTIDAFGGAAFFVEQTGRYSVALTVPSADADADTYF